MYFKAYLELIKESEKTMGIISKNTIHERMHASMGWAQAAISILSTSGITPRQQ